MNLDIVCIYSSTLSLTHIKKKCIYISDLIAPILDLLRFFCLHAITRIRLASNQNRLKRASVNMNLKNDIKFETSPIKDNNDTYFVKTYEKYVDRTKIHISNIDHWTQKPGNLVFISLQNNNGLHIVKCPKHVTNFMRLFQDEIELDCVQMADKDGYVLRSIENTNKTVLEVYFICSSSCFRKENRKINLRFTHLLNQCVKQEVNYKLYISTKPRRSLNLLSKNISQNSEGEPSSKTHKPNSQSKSALQNVNQADHEEIKRLLERIVN